eukprot:gene15873-7204_t
MSEKYTEGDLKSSGSLGHEGNLKIDRLGGGNSALEETTREMERLKMHQTNLRRYPHAKPANDLTYGRQSTTNPGSKVPVSKIHATATTAWDLYACGPYMPPFGRQRPRSLRLHSPNGKVAPTALIAKLATLNIKPYALARTPNKDLEITFHTVEDKHRFLRLPFVQLSSKYREPGKQNPAKRNDKPKGGTANIAASLPTKAVAAVPVPKEAAGPLDPTPLGPRADIAGQ